MNKKDNIFKEIFDKSPLGIFCYDKKGNLIDANPTALKIAGIDSIDNFKKVNLFDNPDIALKKLELLEKGLIKFQSQLNYDDIKNKGFYVPTRSGTAFIDWTVSVTDSNFLVQIQDITEREKDVLLDNEEHLRLALESANLGTWDLDLKTDVAIRSLRHDQIWGFKKAQAEWRFEKAMKYVLPEDRQHILDAYTIAMKTGSLKHINRVIWPDGSIHWIEVDGKVHYDNKGHPVRVMGVVGDITEHKNSEMQINRQNKLLNGINKVFQQSLTCETIEEVVEKCLEVAEELTGSDFSFIGEVNENGRLDDRAVSPPGGDACTADPKKARELLSDMEIVSYWGRTVKEGRSQIVNDPDSDPDKRGIPEGHPPIKSFLGVPLKQGNTTIGLIALANKEGGYTEEDKDNIETLSVAFVEALKRKQAEIELKNTLDHLEEQVEERALKLEDAYETLKEKEIKYRSLYENAPVGIFHSTLDGKYIDVNPELAKLLGYDSPEDLVSTANKASIADIIYVNKDLRPGFLKSALKDNAWFKTENLYRRKDGKIIIGDLSFRDFGKDENGNPTLEGFMTDITKRKKAEEKLKETISELERSNKELESFAYITSHDLQEPLRTIASYAQLIERRYKGKLDSNADEFIEFMVDGSRRMKQMIQGLLDYSRVGTRGHEFTEFESEDALNYALSNLGSAVSEVDAEITNDELPVIFADKGQIVRVFQNLIGNALKFRNERVQLKIYISTHKEENEYVFSVSDNGIGLEEQYSDQIFEVFKRLHAIGEYQGTGIGLAIVKRIIDRHGGRVWVDSEPGEGSTFYFTIPLEKN
ncbi:MULTISPECIES: PAS domain S-box protein [Methanobacterium]|uniref:histidine kinase n=1 Tax=Methanobacterium bryantii TaxID=2161 RepID=A0A2A2H638_METBR|nr:MULTISPECIES: PAS domain S-box protein [Methanobacterium]PAV04828.1 hypothetical protein ASJ80_10990 [Methanobacterium bryantii]